MDNLKQKLSFRYEAFRQWLTLKKAIPIGIGLIVLLLLLFIVRIKPTPLLTGSKFEVTFSSPQDSAYSSRPDIILHFNEPVSPEHAGHFITTDPPVTGEWLQGGTPNILYMTPSQNIPRNSYVEVTVKKGLPSQKGNKLAFDYKFKFFVYYEADRIALQKGVVEGKIFSFPQETGAKFNLKVVGNYSKPSIKVYKASVNDLLNDLTYTQEENYSDGFTQGNFKQSATDVSRLEFVKEYTDLTYEGPVEFSGETGLYLFASYDGDKHINNTWVTLNKSGIHFRQDDQDFYLAPQDLQTGNPESGFKARFYTLKDSVQKIGELDLEGIAKFNLEYPKRLDLVTAQKGEDVIIIPVALPESLATIRTYQNLRDKDQIFLYADRPIYRKGDKVQFRGIVRSDNDANYGAPTAKTIHVYLDAYDEAAAVSRKVVDQTIPLGPGGKFSGEFKLPENLKGNHSLTATTKPEKKENNYSTTYASFDVYEYVKPEFGLDVILDRNEYIKGDEITANVKGYYFDGRPLANQKVFVSAFKQDFFETEKKVYNESFNITGWGGMCGGGGFDDYMGEQIGTLQEVSLDKNGNGQFKLKTKDLGTQLSQKITIVADKNYIRDEDLSMRVLTVNSSNSYEQEQQMKKERISSARTALVHNGDFNIFIMPFTNSIKDSEPFTAYFYSESLNGAKMANREFKYLITQEIYDSTASKYNTKIFKQGTVTTNSEGVGQITDSVTASENGAAYYLNVESPDGRGNNISAKKNFYVYKADDSEYVYDPYSFGSGETLLKIVSEESNLTPGNFANLSINSPDNINVFVTFDRGRVYAPQWLKLQKGDNQFRFHVADEFMPSVTPTFSYFYKGAFRVEGMTFNVPAMKKLITVEISADKPKYNPGDTATLTITTKNHEGVPVSAEIGASVVDKAIYALKKRAESPLHSSFYYLRNRSTNISSSLTWVGFYQGGRGGGGGGGGGPLDLFKDVDTLYWNPDLKTGADGKAVIKIPVGQSKTTWRALIYASTDDTNLGQSDFDFLVSD